MADFSRADGGDSDPIPPIEIGSFIALRPDKSEFIGSASGVFFTNTVFRAFARFEDAPSNVAQSTVTADTGSSQNCLAAVENGFEQTGDDDCCSEDDVDGSADESVYGLKNSGLGEPPSAESAKQLLMRYFQDWHPFFPFLHGPAFFDQVSRFYEHGSGLQPCSRGSRRATLRSKVCQAVTFQCIFNIAASSPQTRDLLPSQCRIKSVSSLMSRLGMLSSCNDMAALQALLAMQLFLMTRMSLRAASTVRGVLTQCLYHAGLHRCPYRYAQFSPETCNTRQRVFWCAYILDHQISQSLGHPPTLKDEEIDVCIPNMQELHRPADSRAHISGPAQDSDVGDVQAHLPSPEDLAPTGSEVATAFEAGDAEDERDLQSQVHHHKASPEEAGGYTLGYLVIYSRLLNTTLGLFHQSIHSRRITRRTVTDLTYSIHSWWNSLPMALQEESADGCSTRYSAFFGVSYHYLIILINRPFLSLPTHRTDFRSSLQSAIVASRGIVRTLGESKDHGMLFSWPAVLSATWMSGLVLAYASLLKMYPLEKTSADFSKCFLVLDSLNPAWQSVRHCRVALARFLNKLKLQENTRQHRHISANFKPSSGSEAGRQRTRTPRSPGRAPPFVEHAATGKRRRMNEDMRTVPEQQTLAQGSSMLLQPDTVQPRLWQPVLEYRGPDFGFDSNYLADAEDWQTLLDQNIDVGSGGLFEGAEWDAYMQGFEDRL